MPRTHSRSRQSNAPAPLAHRILLVTSARTRPVVALRRALALSRVLDAELHVLALLPEHANPFLPSMLDELPRSLANARALRRDTLDWFAEVAGEPLAESRLRIRFGDLVAQAAPHAAKLAATLIVLAPHKRRAGSQVIALADSSRIPVLVARKLASRETIVAATDLADGEYPVLRKAAELCRRLQTPLVAMHNVNPMTVTPSSEMPWPIASAPCSQAVDSKRALLELASERLPVSAEPVLGMDVNPADAILHEAQARDADMIVVGTRPSSWLDRVVMGSVAQQVVNRARRSVLVMPLAHIGRPGAAPLGSA